MELYHASKEIVQYPEVRKARYTKDFSWGFYCTNNMQQAVRISDNTAFFLLGEMIEYNNTEKLFSIPSDKRTEDYITGRFG